MNDEVCISFLQWCLPRVGLRWEGFRKVRGQVCKRISERLQELHIRSINEYMEYLKKNNNEWDEIYSLCFATVSKFYRDHRVFVTLENQILPGIAKEKINAPAPSVRCWSAGSCSGEEPFTLSILWKLGVSDELTNSVEWKIIATDYKKFLIERAEKAIYPESSIKELPEGYQQEAFNKVDDMYQMKEQYKRDVEFRQQDIRQGMPEGTFDIVLCRNLVFTYFKQELQGKLLRQIVDKISDKGYLIIGQHESIPTKIPELRRLNRCQCIFQKVNK